MFAWLWQDSMGGSWAPGAATRPGLSVDGMKRPASRSTWWHTLPHKSSHAVNAAERKDQPWTILASTCTRGKVKSCILAEGGELIEQRIRTEPERFAAVLGKRPRARILIEASTDSEWVARCLEWLGHEVTVLFSV
jgi:hypothetical protein